MRDCGDEGQAPVEQLSQTAARIKCLSDKRDDRASRSSSADAGLCQTLGILWWRAKVSSTTSLFKVARAHLPFPTWPPTACASVTYNLILCDTAIFSASSLSRIVESNHPLGGWGPSRGFNSQHSVW
jgi:hypothetical protein